MEEGRGVEEGRTLEEAPQRVRPSPPQKSARPQSACVCGMRRVRHAACAACAALPPRAACAPLVRHLPRPPPPPWRSQAAAILTTSSRSDGVASSRSPLSSRSSDLRVSFSGPLAPSPARPAAPRAFSEVRTLHPLTPPYTPYTPYTPLHPLRLLHPLTPAYTPLHRAPSSVSEVSTQGCNLEA